MLQCKEYNKTKLGDFIAYLEAVFVIIT